jgi:SAM-dependent methyltransferase
MIKVEEEYLEKNRKAWNEKTEVHIHSDFYRQEEFLKGKSSLKDIELDLLGDVHEKSILHLQCHFGQDTISLQRMGAAVTGVDISDIAIDKARQIAKQLDVGTEFICCNIYDLPKHLDKQFDIVFTSYGTIGWLPDLDKWAAIITKYLRPGGRFVFVEFHPVIWMFDDDFGKISYRYFKSDPIIETVSGTYADKGADITSETISWNHATSEVLNSLIRHGLQINAFNEYDYSPYDCFNKTVEISPGKFRIAHLKDKIPMVFSLEATKT